jgi:biopolymer transport protein ExbD
MHLRRPARALIAAIPTASMADIAFLLIVFFMVTTAYSLDQTPMELPQTKEQEQTAKGAAIIAVTRDGQFLFSPGEQETQTVADIGALAIEIRRVTSMNALHPFTIKADREAPYRLIDQVLEQLRSAGAENVTLLSRAEGLS